MSATGRPGPRRSGRAAPSRSSSKPRTPGSDAAELRSDETKIVPVPVHTALADAVAPRDRVPGRFYSVPFDPRTIRHVLPTAADGHAEPWPITTSPNARARSVAWLGRTKLMWAFAYGVCRR